MKRVRVAQVQSCERSIKRLASEWVCARCSLAGNKRSYSITSRRREVSGSQQGDGTLEPSRTTNKDFDSANHSEVTKAPKYRTGQKYFSLIQPTGIPHLGNYLGALRTWKDLQDQKTDAKARRPPKHKLMFGLADLHSLTLQQDAAVRAENIRYSFASLLAIGLDPNHSQLFAQSHIPEHSELMWYLSTVASFGRLERMTQWKDKIDVKASDSVNDIDEKARERLKLALFSYPVLQAADILLYQADVVPVGEDQAQHVEFTRALARSFNAVYAKDSKNPLLIAPSLMVSPAKRVMSLTNPNKKMSKSDPDPMSRILITDTPEEIRRKIKRAVTDSVPGPITYDAESRPGVANLIDILRHVTRTREPPTTIVERYANLHLKELKAEVAEAVVTELAGIKERFDELIAPGNRAIDDAMHRGWKYARGSAGDTMARIRPAMGLIPR